MRVMTGGVSDEREGVLKHGGMMDIGSTERKRRAAHGCKEAAHLLPLATW